MLVRNYKNPLCTDWTRPISNSHQYFLKFNSQAFMWININTRVNRNHFPSYLKTQFLEITFLAMVTGAFRANCNRGPWCWAELHTRPPSAVLLESTGFLKCIFKTSVTILSFLEAVSFFSLKISFWETHGNHPTTVPCTLYLQRLKTKVPGKWYPASRNRENLIQIAQESGQLGWAEIWDWMGRKT